MNPMYEFEDIDDFLHDRMSESDRQAFELALQTDTDLAQRVEALRAESKVLRLLRDEHLLSQFADWEKELDEKKTTAGSSHPGGDLQVVSRNWRRWIAPAVAAAVVGIAAIGYFLEWGNTNPEQPQVAIQVPVIEDTTSHKEEPVQKPVVPDKYPKVIEKNQNTALYAALGDKQYRPQNFKITLMGDHPDETETPLTKAINLYDSGKYQAALRLLEQPDEKQKQQYLYLRAYTLYNLKRYGEAEQDFRQFRDFKFSRYKLDAQWGEVFSLVKQLPSASVHKRLDALLQEMIDTDHYKDRAISLQADLKKIEGK